ncbi:hypothetical protein [Oceanotoga phage vB_OteS-UFV02]
MSVRLLDKYNVDLKIDEMKKTEVPLTDNVNRNLKGKDKVSSPNFDTVTLVNLLGSYGNFENDYSSEYFFNSTLNNNIEFWGKGTTTTLNVVEGNGFIIIDIPATTGNYTGVDEYEGWGDEGYIWDFSNPSTALTIIDGGFIESTYTWDYNNPSSALEVQ